MQAVISNQVTNLFDALSTDYPHHRSGRVRILTVASETRNSRAPEFPTFMEARFPDYVVLNGSLLVALAKTLKIVIDKLHQATRAALADKVFAQEVESLGLDLMTDITPEKTAYFIRSEIARWAPVLRKAGIRMES